MSSAAFRSIPFLAAAASLVMFAFSSNANAQSRATGAGSATVTILPAITTEQMTPLNFGQVLSPSAAGSIVVSPDGGVTCSGGVRCDLRAAPARFRVGGASGMATVTVQNTVQMVGPDAQTMTFQPLLSGSQLRIDGPDTTFSVGGVLALSANQGAGKYSATYDIRLEYQ